VSAADRLRVTHILTRPELGGAQANTLWTVGHLDRARFDPELITSPDGPLAAEAARIPGARVTFLPELVREIRPLTDWAAARALVRRLLTARPDIVHTHSSKAGILGRWAARRAGVPVVVHSVHGFPFHGFQPRPVRALYVALERAAARWTDSFICVSDADIDKGERHGIFRRGQVVRIRSGIDLGPLRAAAGRGVALRRELGIPAGAPLAVMVACLKPQKDPLTFVRLAGRVRAALPESRFLLVGDGELRPAIERARAATGLADALLLSGWRRDIPAIMDAADVVVLTSLHEGLPRVVPEAMAAGRPVVATAVDGTPEAVRHGETGYLMTPGDDEGGARFVIELLRQPDRARALGAEGARRVDEFDIGRMVRQQEELYDRLSRSPIAGAA